MALLRCVGAQVGFVTVGAFVRRLRLGVAATSGQVGPYALAWERANHRDHGLDGSAVVVLGDSAGQGIGAGAFDQGYVGQRRARLDARDGCAVSGVRVADVVGVQLPLLTALPAPRTS